MSRFSPRHNKLGIYKQYSPFGTKICLDICLQTLAVLISEQFSESEGQGKLSFEELLMSKDKYPSIFLKANGGFVVIILQIFFATYIWGISRDIPCLVLAGAFSVM